jgi:hypothetical protein
MPLLGSAHFSGQAPRAARVSVRARLLTATLLPDALRAWKRAWFSFLVSAGCIELPVILCGRWLSFFFAALSRSYPRTVCADARYALLVFFAPIVSNSSNGKANAEGRE